MGGAERTARKRRQAQRSANTKVVSKAAKTTRGTDTKKVIAVVAAIAVLAAVVIGGVLWTNASKNATEGASIPVGSQTSVEYPEKRDGLAVVSGEADAPATIDVYADFLCPVCGRFYQQYGDQIQQAVEQGKLRVRTHMVPLLVEASDPPGYSLDAANAALLAADAGKFTPFHDALFEHQPEEGKRGYDKQQLIQLGRDLGITSKSFAEGVRNGKYDQELTAKLDRVLKDPKLQQDFGQGPSFGTPTVVSNGSIVDIQNENWLTKLLDNTKTRS